MLGFLLVNLLVVLEVADRLSLKGELEVAREIQLAMLPRGTYAARDIEIFGVTRPANTVGGDFYDVLPLPDGQVIVALGDVAGKGSPAALLMALLLAVLRTLVDERLEPAALVARLNVADLPAQPGVALHHAVLRASTTRRPGDLTYVNAGQNPPLIRRLDGRYERLGATGVALGMFEGSTFAAARDDRAAGRAAGALQRRDHRSREPGRAAVRGGRARAGARRVRRRAARLSWPPTSSPRSNATPIVPRSSTI